MSKFLVIQDGKDAELESVLVEKHVGSGSGLPRVKPGAADSAQALSGKPSLSVRTKDPVEDQVVFDLRDLHGHSVELSLPLDAPLVDWKRAVGGTEALASGITPPGPLARPLTTKGFRQGKGWQGSGDRSRWRRSEELAKLQNEADRAMLILKSVLQLASRDSSPEPRGVRLQSLLARTIRLHRQRYPERTFEVLGQASHLALAEPHWMDLVLALLLNNAERHSPPGSAFELDSFDDGDKCSVAFVDQSGGEHLERSLELWDLYDPSEPSDAGGSGITLSLGRQLVESMHGEVWCSRRRQGGSALVISLPRARRRGRVVSLPSRMRRS